MVTRQFHLAKPLFDIAQLARRDNDPRIRSLVLAAALSTDPAKAAPLVNHLGILAAKQVASQIPFGVPAIDQGAIQRIARPIGLGFVRQNNAPIILPIDLLTQHAAIFGATGEGKSTLMRLLIRQAPAHTNVWVFDIAKGGERDLARVIDGLLVLRVRHDLAWNPLHVQRGLNLSDTISLFVFVFCYAFGLLEASSSLLRQAIHEEFQEREAARGASAYPTLSDVRARIASKPFRAMGRASQYREAVLNRLDALLWEAPQVYAYERGFAIEELAAKNVVFEMDDLGHSHIQFLSLHLLTTLFRQRLAIDPNRRRLETLAFFDEASAMAPPPSNVEATGWSPLAQLLRMGRSAGIGFCLASQTTRLDDAILENARIRLVFRLGHGNDIERIAKALSLDDDQARYISRLKVGECVVSIAPERPFLLTVPRVDP